jgi:hypothetical protein
MSHLDVFLAQVFSSDYACRNHDDLSVLVDGEVYELESLDEDNPLEGIENKEEFRQCLKRENELFRESGKVVLKKISGDTDATLVCFESDGYTLFISTLSSIEVYSFPRNTILS